MVGREKAFDQIVNGIETRGQIRLKRCPIRAHEGREAFETLIGAGQIVCLGIRDHLKPVFQLPMRAVVACQRFCRLRGYPIRLRPRPVQQRQPLTPLHPNPSQKPLPILTSSQPVRPIGGHPLETKEFH